MRAVYVCSSPVTRTPSPSGQTALNEQKQCLGRRPERLPDEELRDPENYAPSCADCWPKADVFIASRFFIEDVLGQKSGGAVAPHRDRLKAAVVFPSMPGGDALNKLGTFSMASWPEQKKRHRHFMKKRKGGQWRPASRTGC